MRLLRITTFVVPLLIFSTTSAAQSVEEKGKALAVTCSACHGEAGISNIPIYPSIAGQQKVYLEMALKAYRSKERKGMQAEAMYGIASQLSDEDIKALAAYFNSL